MLIDQKNILFEFKKNILYVNFNFYHVYLSPQIKKY